MEETYLDHIIKVKKDKKISNYYLAKEMGVAESSVGRWLKKQNQISLKDFLRICEILNIKFYFSI